MASPTLRAELARLSAAFDQQDARCRELQRRADALLVELTAVNDAAELVARRMEVVAARMTRVAAAIRRKEG